jgi:hypothetical protein
MAGMVFNVSDVPADISSFPNGIYEAVIKEAKTDVADSGDTFIILTLELYHPTLGTARTWDRFYPNSTWKAKCLWMALMDWSEEEMVANPEFELVPEQLKGAQVLVKLGEKEGKKDKKIYKNIVPPFYFPTSRIDLLPLPDDLEMPL